MKINYTKLSTVGTFAVPIVPAFVFGHMSYIYLEALPSVEWWMALPVAIGGAVGIEILGAVCGGQIIKAVETGNRAALALAMSLMIFYVSAGLWKLDGVARVLFAIAPAMYLSAALQRYMDSAETRHVDIVAIEDKLQSVTTERDTAAAKLAESQAKSEKFESDYNAAINEAAETEVNYHKLQATYAALAKEFESAESNHKNTDYELESLQESYDELQTELKLLQIEMKQFSKVSKQGRVFIKEVLNGTMPATEFANTYSVSPQYVSGAKKCMNGVAAK